RQVGVAGVPASALEGVMPGAVAARDIETGGAVAGGRGDDVLGLGVVTEVIDGVSGFDADGGLGQRAVGDGVDGVVPGPGEFVGGIGEERHAGGRAAEGRGGGALAVLGLAVDPVAAADALEEGLQSGALA